MNNVTPRILFIVALLCSSLVTAPALADGTETLGPPSVPIQPGTALVGDGAGLVEDPGGTIEFTVPGEATVVQALLYWNGFHSAMGNGDNEIVVNGVPITGTLIGGPRFFFAGGAGDTYSSTYRADITGLGLVVPGPNAFTITGRDFDRATNGATILAIIDDGSGPQDIQLVDGQDLAFLEFESPLDTTVPQTFNFTPSAFDRNGELVLLAGSVQGPASGSDPIRPNIVRVSVEGLPSFDFIDPFASISGPEWDHVVLQLDENTVNIPAGASSMVVQALSADDGSDNQPASFAFMAAVMSIPEPFCGDGNQDAGETCDPPGTPAGASGNACRDDCTVCGDGNVDPGEECDDGNAIDDDACRNDCVEMFCGDGTVDPGETCDPPGQPAGASGNACRQDCTVCGDGVQDGGEACDDGNNTPGDGCDNDCTVTPFCGDGDLNVAGETCDPPSSPAGVHDNLCRDDCTVCGDGVVDAGEDCDDANTDDGDACGNDCKAPVCGDGTIDPQNGETCEQPGDPAGANDNLCRDDCTVCGDGVVDAGEDCDDANTDDGDACGNDCKAPVCGDGTIDPQNGETCEQPGDPAGASGNDCRDDCTVCGDGILDAGEDCDDNNNVDDDGCRNDCTVPACGDGQVDPENAETCDPPGDPAGASGNDCRDDCTVCGDGVTDAGESCDDGNNVNDDDCRNDCTACGDGVVNGDEECDFAAPDAPADCGTECRLVCPDLTVDKQVSCDSGLTWSDGCAGWDDPQDPNNPHQPEVLVRYVVDTAGVGELVDCELIDSNPAVLTGPVAIGTIGEDVVGQVIHTTGLLDCDDELEAGEPNTATLVCACSNTSGPDTIQAQDTAEIECLLPALEIEKDCGRQDVETGLSAVHITVTNPANPSGATMVNCSIQERLMVAGPDIPVPFNSGLFDLAPGESRDFDLDIDLVALGVEGNALNAASVICEIAGGGGKIFVAGDTDECETCQATVDKQVSCDGGVTWEDTCTGRDEPGEPSIKVRYVADVPGGDPLFNCTLTDSNGEVLPLPVDVGTIPGASSGTVIHETDLLTCSPELEAGEPNTATLVCECYEDASGQFRTVDDPAEIACTRCGDGVIQSEAGETCEPSDFQGSGELIADGGFEAGPLSGIWTELSTNFGQAVYGDFPADGSWHVWIGGSGGAFEEGGVSQSVTLPDGPAAELRFQLWLATCSGDPADFFEVRVNDDVVFSVDMTDARCGAGYAEEVIDLSAYVGQTIDLTLFGSTANNGVDSNIFVDDVSLEVLPAEDDCRDDCTFCGDGIANGDEGCDDGNDIDDDDCRNDCTFCGDLVVNDEHGETCDPPAGAGSGELITDGSFEAGPGAGLWVENSTNFGQAIYGTPALTGSWGVWIGGSGGVFEEGGVEQMVTLPSGAIADLKFWLNLATCSGVAGDFFEVRVNDDQLLLIGMDDADACAFYAEYREVVLDLSAYTDTTINLKFNGVTATTGIDSNIFLDDVTLEVLQSDSNCREDCTFCGDGILNGDEECDFNDPNAVNCNEECIVDRFCGDGVVTPELSETCDPPGDPAGASGNDCRDDCTVCGDGVVDPGESCDDGNNVDDDGCRNDCTFCGDGTVDGQHDETCDPPGVGQSSGELVVDGSFEAGTPNPFWTEFSSNFGTTLCDFFTCGQELAFDGDWWSWFGGTSAAEEGLVSQPIELPEGSTATLSFQLWLITCSGEAGDFFEVTVNDDVVFGVNLTDPRCDNGFYSLETVDLSAYAGSTIELTFRAVTGSAGTSGNIFLDDVSLQVFGDNLCRDDCTVCGDGVLDAGEACDDGNDIPLDGCENDCTVSAFCGDGVVSPELGETCDPPGAPAGASGNDCRGDCTVCGDGVLDAGEACDDGNNTPLDGCENDCTVSPVCGDGTVDAALGETCDPPGDPAGASGNDCRDDCTVCGDGVLDAGEDCDDGNNTPLDGCENDCTVSAFCGDGEVSPDLGETCDPPGDPAGASGNECRDDCTVCGDGVVDAGEACDDGNADDFDDCNNACEVNRCDVRLDKQVSCDGGQTYADAGFGDGVTGSCIGWDGDPEVRVRYVAQTDSTADLVNCELVDANGLVLPAPVAIGGLPGDLDEFVIWEVAPLECSAELEAFEPATATLTCECYDDGSGVTASDSDEASIGCQAVALEVTKDCANQDPATGESAVSVTVGNPANPRGATLTDCIVKDELAGFMSAPFSLAPGESRDFDLSVAGLAEPTLNIAWVDCEIVGAGGKRVGTDALDLCRVCPEITLDKQVSCDGGDTFVDVGDDGGLAETCTGREGGDIEVLVRFVANGLVDGLHSDCVIEDSNGAVLPAPQPIFGFPGAVFETPLKDCDANLAAGEPDTAVLTCTCYEGEEGYTVSATDQANIECVTPECGDGIVETNETCDPPGDPAGASGNACRENCTVCGDGELNSIESCDDGNNVDDDGCRNDCTFCGDGIVDSTEDCDDGNNDDGDGCSSTCTAEEQCELSVVKTCRVPDVADGDDDDDDDDDCNGKVLAMKFRYTGEGCDATNNDQSGRAGCWGDAAMAEPVHVKISDVRGDRVYADVDDVFLGDVVEATAANAGVDKFDSQTSAWIDHGLQDVTFHTSCSKPLNVGDQFGSLLLVELTTTEGGTVALPPPAPETGMNSETSECTVPAPPAGPHCDGKVKAIQFRYLGGDCTETDHDQGDAAGCQGTTGSAEPVRITCFRGDTVYLDTGDAIVGIGDVVEALAANAGATRFGSETHCAIYDDSGAWLQDLRFHTSCSKPLNLGDRFGALELFGLETTADGQMSLAAEVFYDYRITNHSAVAAENVIAIDSELGEVPGSPIAVLGADETVTLSASALISETTTNTVTVTGTLTTGDVCDAVEDTATVTVEEAPTLTECTTKIDAMLLQYIGPDLAGPVTVEVLPRTQGAPVVYEFPDGLDSGTVVASPDQNGFTVDPGVQGAGDAGSKTSIFINGDEEVHHTSCSTPYIAGLPAPLDNPKGDPSPTWFVVGFTEK